MRGIAQDLAYCARNLVRAPVFTLTVVLILAMAFATNVTVGSLAWNVLYRPLPFAEASGLVNINIHSLGNDIPGVTAPLLARLARNSSTLSAIAGWRNDGIAIKDRDTGRDANLDVVRVEPKLFGLLGLRPACGGLLSPDDTSSPSGNVLVAQGFAEARYGSCENALGKTLDHDGGSYHIVGVMPVDVGFARAAKVWLPLVFSPDELLEKRENILMFNGLSAIARVAPNLHVSDAESELTSELLAMASPYSVQKDGIDTSDAAIRLTPLRKLWSHDIEGALHLLLLAVLSIFAVTGANVCNLHLARLATRQRISAVQATLGATPARRCRLLLIEATALVGMGMISGIVCLPAGLKLLGHFEFLPQNTPFAVGIDTALIFYLVTLGALLIAVMTLLGYRLNGNFPSLHDMLKQGGMRGTTDRAARRTRSVLIVAQVILTTLLLIGTGLLIHSAQRLLATDIGFDREHLIVAAPNFPEPAAQGEAHRSAMQGLRERAVTIPGIAAAGVVDYPPFSYTFLIANFQPPGMAVDGGPPQTIVLHRNVDQRYFAAMGQTFFAGRAFDADEVKSGLPVAIVDTKFAQRYFPQGNSVGRHFLVSPDAPSSYYEVTIVGVVNSVTLRKLDEAEERPTVYLPGADGNWLVVRTDVDPAVVERSISQIASEIVPGGTFGLIATMNDQIADTVSDRTRLNQLLELLSVVALLLASVGLYAVMAYSVRMRSDEFGTRLAIGATPVRIELAVMWQGMRLIGAGLAIGLPLAYIASGAISASLYATERHDPATFLVVTLLVVSIGLLASWWPARNAARVDPMTALRAE